MELSLNERLVAIGQNGDGLLSLTDLWKAMGSPDKKSPSDWQTRESTAELIDTLADILNTPKMGVLKSTRGRHGGGTWAHKNLALSYAKWLSPELHLAVNQAFIERLEEEANPELAIQRGTDRAVKTWKKQGKSDKWIESRMSGVATRKAFTSALAAHGVKQNGYRNCTNAIYTPLYGGTSEVVRHKKGLSDGASIRDSMDSLELAAVNLAEHMAQRKIEQAGLNGNAQCEIACSQAARHVARALMDNSKQPLTQLP